MTESETAQYSERKKGLHPRNPHRFRYNFVELTASCPELSEYVSVNNYGDESIDFADPSAVKTLNYALLKTYYGISFWDIPDKYLCPPVPGRADYIHYIADLLASRRGDTIPMGKQVSILDIGVGANCIYPIIGTGSYDWRFTGTDIDPVSIEASQKIINSNSRLAGSVELRLQKSDKDIFNGIIKTDDSFDAVICNPPFHSSPEDAASGTLRKLNNLNRNKKTEPLLNFGGQNRELWTPGGEETFIRRMIYESSLIPEKCLWFTTLVSKKTTLPGLYKALKKTNAVEIKKINMAQGNKISRIIAWSYLDRNQQRAWDLKRSEKPDKEKD